ncbi:hypothetical protein [Falsiroseomonas sp. CW058]|uniref:hypothetical protein n=1 Tax=Falsiroseomonas sp. CW058 TaxID=3388664 RepID=UPI003D317A85
MKRVSVALLPVLAAAALPPPAAARDAFEGTFTVDGQTTTASRRDAEDFVDIFSDAGLRSLFSNYGPTSATNAEVSLRGVPATLSYDAGSTTLRLRVPGAGIDESFTGATRDASQDLALEWLRGRGGAALTRLLQQAVATTPIDPVAGNPNSLMSQMGASDFNLATGGAPGGGFSLGARFGSYSAEGFDTRVWTLPLGYSFGMSNGATLLVDAPLTLLSAAGTQSYSGSLGLGLRVPLRIGLPDGVAWSLTPMLRAGGVGSVSLGAVGGMWSASLTSTIDWQVRPGTSVTIGNMVSRLQTLPIKIGDYDVSYELTNLMYRNGVIATQAVGEWLGRPVQASAFLIDTRFTGDALYVRSYQEFGGYLSFDMQAGGQRLPLSLGVTVLSGDRGYRGYSLNLGVTF